MNQRIRPVIFLPVFVLYTFISLTIAQTKTDSISLSGEGVYIINSGAAKMKVDPKFGGRITSLEIGDYNLIISKCGFPQSCGSTFWPSPQATWNWPPPAILDNKPYSAINNGTSIVLSSQNDPTLGYQFTKEFSAGDKNKFNLVYGIKNISSVTKNVAPWEITRVHKGGLLFFPMGESPIGTKFFTQAPTETIDGILWYKDSKERPDKNYLSITDGSEGWMAFANEGKILIKKFTDTKPAFLAPKEGEVAFYVGRDGDFIEIEIEGKYETLKPGDKSLWNVQWITAEIPANIKVEKGSKELVEFVRELIR